MIGLLILKVGLLGKPQAEALDNPGLGEPEIRGKANPSAGA
jgi:hypothetical protein